MHRATSLLVGSSLVFFALSANAAAQTDRSKTSGCRLPETRVRVFPSADLGCGRRLTYMGAYVSDGKYRTHSEDVERPATDGKTRPAEVPDNVDLHRREQVVEAFAPDTHQTKQAKSRSTIAGLRDEVVTLAYGREKALVAPRWVTTDSRGRVIVSDPGAAAVHVLDANGAWRIAVGAGQRIRSVGAVAVDHTDNIYVADPEAGQVQVFTANGLFVRSIGKIGEDEGLFHDPRAIAVDRERQRLYVVDYSRDAVLVLNVEGARLQTAGGRRQELGVAMQHPSAIVIKRDKIVVLDQDGARIQVFDLHWKILQSFPTNLAAGFAKDVGLDVDAAGNIYASNIDGARVRVFAPDGRVEGEFGTSGSKRGEFLSPAVWIDDNDRMFVAESYNRRVEVFQITAVSH